MKKSTEKLPARRSVVKTVKPWRKVGRNLESPRSIKEGETSFLRVTIRIWWYGQAACGRGTIPTQKLGGRAYVMR